MVNREVYEMVRDAVHDGYALSSSAEIVEALAGAGVPNADRWMLVDFGFWLALLDALDPDS